MGRPFDKLVDEAPGPSQPPPSPGWPPTRSWASPPALPGSCTTPSTSPLSLTWPESRVVAVATAVLAAVVEPDFDPGPPLRWVQVWRAPYWATTLSVGSPRLLGAPTWDQGSEMGCHRIARSHVRNTLRPCAR